MPRAISMPTHPGIVADLANPGEAADRARLPRRGAGAPPRGRDAALHHPLLRQPSVQRRDAAPPARCSSPRCAMPASPAMSRSVALPVEHGRPHRAGDDRCRPRARLGSARRRGRLAGHDRAVPAMGRRGRFSRGTAGWEKFGVDHGARRQALRGDEAAPAQRRAFVDRLSRPARRPRDGRQGLRRPGHPPASSQALWAEAAPTLPKDAGLDPKAYIAALAERFDNTALAHRTAQIANDGSQKLPQRIVGTALDRLAAGRRRRSSDADRRGLDRVPPSCAATRCPPTISPIRSTQSSAQICGLGASPARYGCRGFRAGRLRARRSPHRAGARSARIRPSRHLAQGRRRGRPRRTCSREDNPLETDLALVRPGRSRPARACPPGRRDRRRHARCIISMTDAPGRSTRSPSARPRSRPPGSTWSVVESIIVHEDIKTRSGRFRELIDNYKASIRALSQGRHQDDLLQFHGDHRLDAHRSRLSDVAWRHGAALRHRRFLRL